MVRVKIKIDHMHNAEFGLLIENLNSIHSLKYLSFTNISCDLALMFLQEYKRFAFLKRLIFNLSGKFKLYMLAEFRAMKEEIEANGTFIEWLFTKTQRNCKLFG